MNLSTNHEEELTRLKQFIANSLSPQQERVLELFSTSGLPYKQVALVINRDVKTVEKLVTTITRKYQDFYGPSEKNASFRRIQSRAAVYYFLKDLLEKP